MLNHTEKQFEDDIEHALITQGGYAKGDVSAFDRKLALCPADFIQFIKQSQPKEWQKYEKIHATDSEAVLVERFSREVKHNGLLHVLRKGFSDRGIRFKAIFWKPETDYNPTALAQFASNDFHVLRQLHYSVSNENSIDLVLAINGIPLVSMELKCQFTGQSVTNAINQYTFDRASKDAIFAFNQRVLVHFAVDLTQVYMSTKLQGAATYFLPFNQGSNGAGQVGGKGNPENTDGYQTAYLWERVLTKDSLLEILQKYLHLQEEISKDKKGKKTTKQTLIFPRYHQLDVVSRLLADVKGQGSGKNYLIQHSAGSGKSNSIAWLAHRLCSLHSAENEAIFHSVIIVTDRRVLDDQLQNTVYQFDHVEGVVHKIRKSKDLKDAINAHAKIIITTLQKFPIIFKEVQAENKRFAIIIDEAHSSQTGDAAKKLKFALADTEEILREYAAHEYADEETRKTEEDKMLEELAAHGHQENLSFFAFTATPKEKTLQTFGIKNAHGAFTPYHIYSMRQAIEEGFILDVLKNYMTYSMYFKIAKKIPDDPELDTTAGLAAIRRFETLHPHNIAQKTAVMLEYFNNVTRHKIGGKAKAMVVTPSRLHAVKYYEEFNRQIKVEGMHELNVLVAFSGEINDDGKIYTEESLNLTAEGERIKEKQLPQAFKGEEFGVLIVAEKYQTGFDEPLLHTMFVDKKLSGVKAVQTLSRLNRTMYGKQDTFVLDFVNTDEDIKKSFEPYYEQTILEQETDPNVISDIKNTLDKYRVYAEVEVERFAKIFYGAEANRNDLGKLTSVIKPALDRFKGLNEEDQATFKTGLARFGRIYAFITQVYRMFDKDMHKFSIYARFLQTMLPKDDTERLQVDDKVLLEYYKLEKNFEGSITLESTEGGTRPIGGESGKKEKKKDPLSEIIKKINEDFGTNFTQMDKVLMQLQDDYAQDDKWQGYAKSTDKKTFQQLFEQDFPKYAADRYEQNNQFFIKMHEEPDMMQFIIKNLGALLFERLRG